MRFLDALAQSGDVGAAAQLVGLPVEHRAMLPQHFAKRGIAVGVEQGGNAMTPTGPIADKLISFKADLANAARVVRRLSWLGRIVFSLPAAVIWDAIALFAIAVFLANGDKVTVSMMQLATLQQVTSLPSPFCSFASKPCMNWVIFWHTG